MSVFDLHVHTVKGSSDSSLTPQQLIDEARRIGLDGVCLTEHGGGWDDKTFQETFESSGLTVIRGLEVATEMGHILAIGIHSYVDPGMHRIAGLKRAVEQANGVLISAHPFRNLFNQPPYNVNLVFTKTNGLPETAAEAALHPLFQFVDDVEVANGSNSDKENRFCYDVARELGYRGTGGSDAHSIHGIGNCVTLFDGAIRNERDLINAIKAKAFTPAEGFHKGNLQTYERHHTVG